jgi:hypothetical protein
MGYLRHPGQYVVAPDTPAKNSRIVSGGSSKNRLRQARQYARGSFAKNLLNASRKDRLGATLLISAIAATSESSVGGDGQRVNREIPGMWTGAFMRESRARWRTDGLPALAGGALELGALNGPRLEASSVEVVNLGSGYHTVLPDFDRTLYLISRDHYIAHSAGGAAPVSPKLRAASIARRQRPSPQPLAGLFAERVVCHWEREYAAPPTLAQRSSG